MAQFTQFLPSSRYGTEFPFFFGGVPVESSDAQPITNLRAKSDCVGKQITLSWTPPTGVVDPTYHIKRSRYTFCSS